MKQECSSIIHRCNSLILTLLSNFVKCRSKTIFAACALYISYANVTKLIVSSINTIDQCCHVRVILCGLIFIFLQVNLKPLWIIGFQPIIIISRKQLEQSCALSKKVIGYLLYNNLYPTDLEHGTKLNVFPSIQPAGKNIFYQTANIMEICRTSQLVLVVVAFVLLRNVACQAGTQARVLVAGLGGSTLQVNAARGLRKGFSTRVKSYICSYSGR